MLPAETRVRRDCSLYDKGKRVNDSERQLRALLASQGELVGSVCHDLKGLLTGVEGGLYMVDSGAKKGKPERITKGAEMLKRNLGRMRRTVANILHYVKDRELEWARLDIRELVQSVGEALSERAEELGVTLQTQAEDGWIEGDELAIRALLENVVEYLLEVFDPASHGGPRSVALSATSRDNEIAFEIRAARFSMPEETKACALGDFYAPKGADRSHLGVFVAHKIARNHGGTMELLDAQEPGDSRFVVTLPKLRPSA